MTETVITQDQAYDPDFASEAEVQQGALVYAADGGGTDAYAITLATTNPALAAYVTGMVVHFKANTANTGAATLNVNSLGAKTIKKLNDQDLADNDIEAGQVVTVVYDGTNFQMQSQVANAASGAPSNARYWVSDADGSLSNEVDISALPDGILKHSVSGGVSTPAVAGVNDVSAVLYGADAGSNDTYAVTLSPAPSAYVAGMVVVFKANTKNTGACTLNVNSLGAKTIKKQLDLDLADNDIRPGQVITVVYDGTNFQIQSDPTPVGSVHMWCASTVPNGYLECKGDIVSRTIYARLFDIIGTTFGAGDGSTTFQLPNFSSRSPIGVGDAGAGFSNYAMGDQAGAETFTQTTSTMPSHNHTGSTVSITNGTTVLRQIVGTVGANGSQLGTSTLTATPTIASQGSGSAHTIIHPVLAVKFIIKY